MGAALQNLGMPGAEAAAPTQAPEGARRRRRVRKVLAWYLGGLRRALISWGGLGLCRLRESVRRPAGDYARITVLQSGGLGDAVLTLPLLEGLRRRWPRARVSVVAGKLGREVFAAFAPGLRLLHPGGQHGGLEPDAELIVHLRAGAPAVLASWKNLGAPYLCGLPRHSRLRWSALTYLGLPVPPSREHQYETWRRLGRSLGLNLPDGPRLEVREEWRESLAGKLRGRGLKGRRLAVVHLLGAWAHRAWPLNRWLELLGRLREAEDLEICLVGGAEDLATLRKAGPWPFPVQVLAGELSLGELAALCERAAIFLGNDSGPAHLAAAAGAPALVLYGPQEAALFGIRAARAAIVQGRAFCTPCWQTVCPFKRVRCLEEISVDMVLQRAAGLLRPAAPAGKLAGVVRRGADGRGKIVPGRIGWRGIRRVDRAHLFGVRERLADLKLFREEGR
jgi:ADP-heptose:LPS heptosyltransferase